MSEPFVNIKLENRVLRHLIADDKESEKNFKEILKNITYITNLGIEKNIFYSSFKQWLFEQVVNNFEKHSEPLSRTIILERFQKLHPDKEQFEKRKIYLEKIYKCDFTSVDYRPLIDDLRIQFQYRSLYEINIDLHTKLKEDFESDGKVGDSIKLARQIEESVSKVLTSNDRFRIIEEDVFQNFENDILEIEDRRKNPDKYKGILTGFPKIDEATGGWIPGELTIVLGRPGMGKSVLLLNFAKYAYEMRFNVVYITIEMPIEQQRRRLYSNVSNVLYQKLKKPERLVDEEIERLKKKVEKFKSNYKNYLWFIDAPERCTVNFIESKILRFERMMSTNAELLIIDPIYLMKPFDLKTDDPVGSISWDLKILARKLSIPVICASQFNREAHKRHKHGKDPDTIDAAFTDKLSNNSDNMIGITGSKNDAELAFPKTRDSTISKVFLDKNFDYMRFEYSKRKNERKEVDESRFEDEEK